MRVKARTDETLGDLMRYLSQYDFEIIYSLGRDNIEADSLFRKPVLECYENGENVPKVANLITMQEVIQDQEEKRNSIENMVLSVFVFISEMISDFSK